MDCRLVPGQRCHCLDKATLVLPHPLLAAVPPCMCGRCNMLAGAVGRVCQQVLQPPAAVVAVC